MDLKKQNEPLPVKAYPTLELLQLMEKPTADKVIKKAMATNIFKTNFDMVSFINQNNIVELVDISFDPTLKNVLGGFPWTLFYWLYYAQEAPVS